MKEVNYTDDAGRNWRVRVPDDCPVDRYNAGIPVGPPALDALGLPLDTEVRLHNELYRRGLLTYRDVLAKPNEVMAALQATYKTDLQRLQVLYRDEQGGK
jgi:hypothetical protein